MTLAEYLAEMKKRADAATPGPLSIMFLAPWNILDASGRRIAICDGDDGKNLGSDENLANARFLSEAKTDIPLLLAIIEEQARALEEYKYCRHGCGDCFCVREAREAQARIDALIAKGEK